MSRYPLTPALPIDPVLPAIRDALDTVGRAVLQAPPGAGKTTRVPLALLDADWRGTGRIVMLEPRRIAARAAAARMAESLGEPVGRTVGYRTRLDSKVGDRTAIEVVTEGILTRRLQADPELGGVAAVLFDEFHERSLQADLGLALTLEVAGALRPDLRLLVMSATLDADPVARLLGGPPVITSRGRAFPVETRYRPVPPKGRIDRAVAAVVREALAEESGGLLVFLPGRAEIRRTLAGLEDGPPLPADVRLAPLYGDLSAADQDAAIRPAAPGTRKVVLATAIAETSLTIEGVRVVIDGGLARRPRFDPARGMSGLVTTRAARANADQRRGRAGRTGPGVCYRLWSEPEDRGLPAHPPAEITQADLAPLALDLAAWGTEAAALAWLTPPPAAALGQARDLLSALGALDAAGRITRHGRAMAAFPLHPRLAHMVLTAGDPPDRTASATACVAAALLEERDILHGDPAGVDFTARLAAARAGLTGRGRTSGPIGRTIEAARQTARRLKVGIAAEAVEPALAGRLLALAYPDRVAQARGATGRFRLANGRGVVVDPADGLAAAPFLAVGEVGGAAVADGRVFSAAALTRAEIEDLFGDRIVDTATVAFDPKDKTVRAVRQRRLDAVVLDEAVDPAPDSQGIGDALIEAARRAGLRLLTWSWAAIQLRDRVRFVARHRPDGVDGRPWPDCSETGLRDGLADWLGPYAAGLTRLEQLAEIDVAEALAARLDWPQRQALDRLAPTHWTAPSGSRIALDYGDPDKPVIAAKLQELFGQTTTPAVADGRVALTVHLLSPAGRPLQVTQDLAGFWRTGYPEVAKEMRGRYPKHPWPEDPLTAPATRRVKPRG